MTSYKSIVKSAETELIIKYSRFIGTACPIEDSEMAERLLEEIRTRYKDASHNCYAYIVDDGHMRFSDDGEPQGLAGTPILSVLKKRGLEKVLVVVTRYFGGVKLGGGGLVSAYSAAASAVLEKAGVKIYTKNVIAKLKFEYEKTKNVDLIIKQNGARLLEAKYLEEVNSLIAIEQEKWQDMKKTIMGFNIGIEDESIRFI